MEEEGDGEVEGDGLDEHATRQSVTLSRTREERIMKKKESWLLLYHRKERKSRVGRMDGKDGTSRRSLGCFEQSDEAGWCRRRDSNSHENTLTRF